MPTNPPHGLLLLSLVLLWEPACAPGPGNPPVDEARSEPATAPQVRHGRYLMTVHDDELPLDPHRRERLTSWRGAWEEWVLTTYPDGSRAASVIVRRPDISQRWRLERRDTTSGRVFHASLERRAQGIRGQARFTTGPHRVTAFASSPLTSGRSTVTLDDDYLFMAHSVLSDGLDLGRVPIPPGGLVRDAYVVPAEGTDLAGRARPVMIEDRGETRVTLPMGRRWARHLVWRFIDPDGRGGHDRHVFLGPDGIPLLVQWPGVEVILVEAASGSSTFP